jgi:hypothetical protein
MKILNNHDAVGHTNQRNVTFKGRPNFSGLQMKNEMMDE